MSGLVYCSCGHTGDEHARGGRCLHTNRASKRFPVPAACTCRRLDPDPRLRDSDDFVGKVVEKVRSAQGWQLEPVEREEAEQVLRIALWKTSQKYDSRSHVRFRVYAYLELYNDVIDHIRAERGRHGQHRLLDHRDLQPGLDDNAGERDWVTGTHRLDSSASRDPADDPDSWAADAGGLLEGGDQSPARLERHADGRGAEPDEGRDPRPVRGAPGRPGAEAA